MAFVIVILLETVAEMVEISRFFPIKKPPSPQQEFPFLQLRVHS